jgi:hypothetical protein
MKNSHARGALRVALVALLTVTPWMAASANDAPAKDAERTRINLRIQPNFVLVGHSVQTRVLVEPSDSNRLLIVRIDSPSYYSSTERQLDGEAGPRTHLLHWHELPAGEYQVEVVVKDNRGRTTQTQGTFTVLGPEQQMQQGMTGAAPRRR